ncbi:hypothetical protein CMV_021861 [Castanea mollissima]|uniref:Uncharacterized protein n=1 Tax=Castanea mollissima TaxID=60419 RepID=A0A8J4VK78_9ROSI|nr:hypothetical protein CMV_021861 [Castanea mollissima]
MREQWKIDNNGEFDDARMLYGVLQGNVAHKSNIMWVVTYAQVDASSFSTSVSNIFENQRVDKREWMPFHYSWETFHLSDELSLNRCNLQEGSTGTITCMYLQLLTGYILYHHRQCINRCSSDFNTFLDSEICVRN